METSSSCELCGALFLRKILAPSLCEHCWSRDHARELDRLVSAKTYAQRRGAPMSLNLAEWIAIVGDFSSKCAFCQARPFELLLESAPERGVIAGNCVPACRSCKVHAENGFDQAQRRIEQYLTAVESQLQLGIVSAEGAKLIPAEAALTNSGIRSERRIIT